MSYLTTKEIEFLNALKEDNMNRKEKSFLHTLFSQAQLFDGEYNNTKTYVEKILEVSDYEKIDPSGYEILSQTQWLFEALESEMVGKYKNHFIGTGSEGEYFSMGLEIQNLATYLVASIMGSFQDDEEIAECVEKYNEDHGIDFYKNWQDYKVFCQSHGLTVEEKYDVIHKQTLNFPH